MLALVSTPGGQKPVEVREVEEPAPAPNEAVVEVRAFSLNRGEFGLLSSRPEGWRPGQDISGMVKQPASEGSGPGEGVRVTALADRSGWAERAAIPTTCIGAPPIVHRWRDETTEIETKEV